MAYYSQQRDINKVVATELNGNDVALSINYTDGFLAKIRVPINPCKKYTSKIVDVSGAKDGAGSIVEVVNKSRVFDDTVQTHRIKETPEELSKIFSEAGLDEIQPTKSLGRVFRDIKAVVLGHQP